MSHSLKVLKCTLILNNWVLTMAEALELLWRGGNGSFHTKREFICYLVFSFVTVRDISLKTLK